MNRDFDIIVIGGGHNGLTAASLSAKRGKKVLLLEQRPILGGIAAGEEFHPGYSTVGLLHDTSCIGKQAIKVLDLESHGLKLKAVRPEILVLGHKGESILLSDEVEKTQNEIAKYSELDAKAYVEYRHFIKKISPFIRTLMDDFPPDLMKLGSKQILQLAKKAMALKRLGKEAMTEFLKVAPMCVADFLNERFETEFIKAGIAAPAIYGSFTGPWSSYTTFNLLIWECLSESEIIEGPKQLVNALENAARKYGVDVRTSSKVKRIKLDGNAKVSGVELDSGETFSAKVVAASCTPQETFLKLLQPNQLDYSTAQSITHFRSRGTTAKINFALKKGIALNGISNVAYARTGNSFDDMERAFDFVKYRSFSKSPVLDIHIPTIFNPDLAPDGCAVVSVLVHFASYEVEGGWNHQNKAELLANTIGQLEHYSPGFESGIVHAEVLSPADLEARYGLTNGQIFHGEHAMDQMFMRPIPSCSRYATPIDGLYLCGSGSHPGGGISCMPGYLGAKMILKMN